VVVCVYRPPGTVTSTFTDQLSDMLDQIMLLGNRFVLVGDFNVQGTSPASSTITPSMCLPSVVCVNTSLVRHTSAATHWT